MERYQAGLAWLKVRELVNVQVFRRADEPLGQLAGPCWKQMSLLSHLKNRLGGFAADDSHGASRSTMVMNRAALPVAPAQNQTMICRTRAHQVAPVPFRRKLDEWLDLRLLQAQSSQTSNQNLQRNALLIFVQLREPLVQGELHNFAPVICSSITFAAAPSKSSSLILLVLSAALQC